MESGRHGERHFFTIVFSFIFFSIYFVYSYLGINSVLCYQWQEPSFYFGSPYLREFTGYPGGLLKYGANFLAQFYLVRWLGALLMTAAAILAVVFTRMIFKTLKFKNLSLVSTFLPAVFLLPYFNLYELPFEIVLGFLLSLCCFVIYIRFYPKKIILKSMAGFLTILILYYLAGGAFFLFIIMVGLYEVLIARNNITPLMLIIMGCVLPVLAPEFFIISYKSAFLINLPFTFNFKWFILPWFLFIYFILLVPVGVLKLDFIVKAGIRFNKVGWLQNVTVKRLLPAAVIIIIAVLLVWATFDKQNRAVLLIDHYAQNRNWPRVVELALNKVSNHRLVAFQAQRALNYMGGLGENMFSLPQKRGIEGLIMTREFGNTAPLQCSQWYFDLGFLNEAQHWAHEALAIKKESPWILQQIVLVSLAKGDYEFAQLCINRLHHTILFKKWAEKYQLYAENPDLIRRDITLANVQAINVTKDCFIRDNNPIEILKFVSENSRNNKMAFEYLMASYLMTGNLDGIIENIPRLKEFNYPSIPRHYEEAVLLATMRGKRKDVNLGGYQIKPQTRERFKDFNMIIAKYPDGKISARKELAYKYGNTLWYYAMYK